MFFFLPYTKKSIEKTEQTFHVVPRINKHIILHWIYLNFYKLGYFNEEILSSNYANLDKEKQLKQIEKSMNFDLICNLKNYIFAIWKDDTWIFFHLMLQMNQ